MKSIIEFELLENGNLVDVTTNSNKIYQGAVATTEYHLTVKNDWRPTDLVWLAFTRPDGLEGQFRMTRKGDGWVITTNGWETDVDIAQHNAILKVSFLMKRYSNLQVGKVAEEKTTETIDMVIHASAGYIPQNIELDTAELLQEQINHLELDKVGRYDASNNGQNIPPHIVYAKNGLKSPNNLYYNFESQAIDENLNTITVKGGLLVFQNDNIQNEILLTDTGEIYERKIINNMVDDFRPSTMIIYDKIYTKTQADARFVHLTGNETIGGTKTFTDSPIVPNASANTHAVNRSDMHGYTYSKTEINNLTEPIGFATYQNFIDWLAGTYSRSDGLLPTGLLVGKKIIIKEEGQNNYQVAELPVVDITDFKVLVEDNKFLEEIGAKAYKNITATDGQAFVNELKDQVDLKAQIIELEDLTIEIADWIDDSGNIYFDYENENFTDPTKQFFEFVSNSKDQNEAIANDGFSILALETILDGADYKVRLFANKVPSIDIVLRVNLINYTNEVFEAGEITANKIIYLNTTSGLTAVNVQDAIDELEVNASATQQSVNNLQNEVSTKQDELVSGVNIKTINNTSLLGSGDITIFGGGPFLQDPDKTYLVIKTPADNDTFTLLTGTDGSPDYTIEWGDGTSENITTTDNPSHEYATAGMYLITISGNFANGISVGVSSNVNKDKIIEVYGGSNYPLLISGDAFRECTSLTTANFPNAGDIDTRAFQNCTSLTTANIPNATSIESYTFRECTSLTTVNFPNATSIEAFAFQNCKSLTTANFPNATSIEGSTFRECTSLTTANFPNATSIESSAFSGCTSLKKLTLGNVTTTDTGTRFYNVKLTNLTIAQDVDATDIDRIKQFYADNGGTFTGAQINSIE